MLATYARIQHYGDGTPDPRTATCLQHQVAAPYSDTAKGDGTDVPESLGWECVVCPLPDADLIGTPVIVVGYAPDDVFLYGGPDSERPGGFMSVSYSLRGGGNVVKAEVGDVAPADTPINLKDARVTVTKLPGKRDYQDSGPWLPAIEHPALKSANPRARKTKREALEWAAVRLAIADYQAARAANAVTPTA